MDVIQWVSLILGYLFVGWWVGFFWTKCTEPSHWRSDDEIWFLLCVLVWPLCIFFMSVAKFIELSVDVARKGAENKGGDEQ